MFTVLSPRGRPHSAGTCRFGRCQLRDQYVVPPLLEAHAEPLMHILCPHCRNPIEVVNFDPRMEVACPSCGSSFHLEAGSAATGSFPDTLQTIGRFDVMGTLGMGAFGTVFKARDPQLDRTVAIKVARRGNVGDGPRDLERFVREARSVAQLRHPRS